MCLKQNGRVAKSILILALCIPATGCAVYYGGSSAGATRVAGLTRYAWHVDARTNGAVAVASGVRIPGLAIGLSPNFFGLSFGYTICENLTVVTSGASTKAEAWVNGRAVESADSHRWSLGQLTFRTPAGARRVFAMGRAVAGIKASVDQSRPQITAGRHTAETIEIEDDMAIDFEGGPFQWPYFDFSNTHLNFPEKTSNLIPSTSP